MKSPITLQLEDRVVHRLDRLSHAFGGYTRAGRSLNRWIAEYALPRFCCYEERRNKQRRGRIDREMKELKLRAREAAHVRALDDDEIREGLKLLDKLQNGGDLSAEENGRAAETMAALLARRKMNLAHARALEEDDIREAVQLADRLRERGMLNAEEWKRVERMLRLD